MRTDNKCLNVPYVNITACDGEGKIRVLLDLAQLLGDANDALVGHLGWVVGVLWL